MKKTIILIFALFLIASCGGDDPVAEAEAGTSGGSCYPNRTCNDGLECSEENICIETSVTDDDTEQGDAGDTASDNDPAESGEDRSSAAAGEVQADPGAARRTRDRDREGVLLCGGLFVLREAGRAEASGTRGRGREEQRNQDGRLCDQAQTDAAEVRDPHSGGVSAWMNTGS